MCGLRRRSERLLYGQRIDRYGLDGDRRPTAPDPSSGPRWSSLQPEEEDEMDTTATVVRRAPWNKGKLVGQKAPLKVKDIWAIRVRLQIQVRTRDRALLDLGIDNKLR